jgi:hypothetical protein
MKALCFEFFYIIISKHLGRLIIGRAFQELAGLLGLRIRFLMESHFAMFGFWWLASLGW